MKQKFKNGDLVKIAKNLGPSRWHFVSDCEAIVQKYGGEKNYDLYIKGYGSCAWYCEHHLTLIEHERNDLKEQWKLEAKALSDKESNIDYIFKNNNKILKKINSNHVRGLALSMGITNEALWGSRGEGFTYYENCMRIIEMATPFLEKKDKNGWLEFASNFKNKRINNDQKTN